MSNPKPSELTDLQLLLLQKASQRDDHAIELPPYLKGGAAAKVVKKLIDGKLAKEVAAKPGMPVWRRDDESRSFALIISHAAFEALGIEPGADADASPAVENADKVRGKRRSKGTHRPVHSKAKAPAQQHSDTDAAPRTGTKQTLILTLLQRQQGATIDDLVAATQWLPHTTRAALTGLRKKGYEIAKDKGESGKTVYRIKAEADPSKEPAAPVSSHAA
jgi:hypothetical protein